MYQPLFIYDAKNDLLQIIIIMIVTGHGMDGQSWAQCFHAAPFFQTNAISCTKPPTACFRGVVMSFPAPRRALHESGERQSVH